MTCQDVMYGVHRMPYIHGTSFLFKREWNRVVMVILQHCNN
jgi:hypothetical protein